MEQEYLDALSNEEHKLYVLKNEVIRGFGRNTRSAMSINSAMLYRLILVSTDNGSTKPDMNPTLNMKMSALSKSTPTQFKDGTPFPHHAVRLL
ncbi:hypothetical protein S7711_11414 [Stachybotrys chartarum IBT 7711]|uniref:Uncharacterized protein n=1 Tax=Stachybotrys chartarum (strain CBS 109288 / IBT 7711) TaxID=1280523 RepID=A0A084AND9_STACB|nr:hypothetical protein S7711_11414 [Stachybotrys chartarum IBT 7711]KFA51190.1 hypothetical protein S40293_11392 [Stachybotrys chartarum IBT 40293]